MSDAIAAAGLNGGSRTGKSKYMSDWECTSAPNGKKHTLRVNSSYPEDHKSNKCPICGAPMKRVD
jgi:hypothetical protein